MASYEKSPFEVPKLTPERSEYTLGAALREIVETVIMALVIYFLITSVIKNFRVKGSSMEPNLHDGQFLIVNRIVYHFHPPQRGDIIVFHPPYNNGKDYIKRVIGLPGETVEIREGRVFINGRELVEPYIREPGYRSWGPAVVGPDELFVLGDNRDHSNDSRSWGMLPISNVIGKAWISYWPPRYWGVIPNYTTTFASPDATSAP